MYQNFRLSLFLHKHDLIKKNQHGFQKDKSTTLATFDLIKTVSEYIDNGCPVAAVLFDMKKAFDYVCHKRLIQKCESYGIRGCALHWLKSYLENRSQHVEISRIDSKTKNLLYYQSQQKYNSYGVPQGSILGPLLFLIILLKINQFYL